MQKDTSTHSLCVFALSRQLDLFIKYDLLLLFTFCVSTCFRVPKSPPGTVDTGLK